MFQDFHIMHAQTAVPGERSGRPQVMRRCRMDLIYFTLGYQRSCSTSVDLCGAVNSLGEGRDDAGG